VHRIHSTPIIGGDVYCGIWEQFGCHEDCLKQPSTLLHIVILFLTFIAYPLRITVLDVWNKAQLEVSTSPYTDSLVINRSIKIRGGDSMWASMCNQVIAQLRATKRY
jgi:hypothetical protein